MLTKRTQTTRTTRKMPDYVTNEIAVVLPSTEFVSFNGLFTKVYTNLKERNAVSGGEEMLRLRTYEKLQTLVSKGLVKKENRKYQANGNIQDSADLSSNFGYKTRPRGKRGRKSKKDLGTF